jgi:hypothetical protein
VRWRFITYRNSDELLPGLSIFHEPTEQYRDFLQADFRLPIGTCNNSSGLHLSYLSRVRSSLLRAKAPSPSNPVPNGASEDGSGVRTGDAP